MVQEPADNIVGATYVAPSASCYSIIGECLWHRLSSQYAYSPFIAVLSHYRLMKCEHLSHRESHRSKYHYRVVMSLKMLS